MQKVEKYKTQKLSSFSQVIILTDTAFIEESCDSIFSTERFKTQPFTNYFPFLESIFEHLLELKVDGKELRFTKIESPLEELPGVYDFTFNRAMLDGKEYTLWSIYDYTALYEDFKQYQQKRNELEIHREILEARNRNLHHQKDILAKKNLVLENWDEIRKGYFNKVRLALQSPVNALDGLSFILSNLSKESNQDYISALRASVRQLQDIIAEFELVTTIDGEKQISEIRSFAPQKVVDLVKEKLSKSALGESIQAHFSLAPELPEHLLGNPRHLQQILYQLLLNAQKHNTNSHLELIIGGEKQAGGQWCLDIRILENPLPELAIDTNLSNLEDDSVDLIFRLSLVKKLIELEGGNIRIENRPGSDGFLIHCLLTYPLIS